MTDLTNRSLHPMVKSDAKALLGIFAVSFVLFLFVALFAQLAGCQWRSWLPGAEGEKSLVGGVKASVYTFMSYLT
jgi:light-harvesting complex 1 beta chain